MRGDGDEGVEGGEGGASGEGSEGGGSGEGGMPEKAVKETTAGARCVRTYPMHPGQAYSPSSLQGGSHSECRSTLR